MKNKPYKYQILAFLITISFLFFYFENQRRTGAANNSMFYAKKFSATILTKEVYYGRSMEYTLSNGLNMFFLLNAHENINVGDSITKDANTYNFDVYRKNADSSYYFVAKYRLNEGL